MRGAIKQPHRRTGMVLAASAFLAGIALPAVAQQPTQAQRNAIRQSCRADYEANCASVSPGGMAALQCLQQHAANLSAPCRAAVGAVGAPAGGGAQAAPATHAAASTLSPRQKMAVLRRACGEDYRRVCRGVRMGGGRGLECLKANAASLSPACRRVLGRVSSAR